jgi:hypothetical protein
LYTYQESRFLAADRCIIIFRCIMRKKSLIAEKISDLQRTAGRLTAAHSEAGTPRVTSARERPLPQDLRAFSLSFQGSPLACIELHTPADSPLQPGMTFSGTIDFRTLDNSSKRAACRQVSAHYLSPLLFHGPQHALEFFSRMHVYTCAIEFWRAWAPATCHCTGTKSLHASPEAVGSREQSMLHAACCAHLSCVRGEQCGSR